MPCFNFHSSKNKVSFSPSHFPRRSYHSLIRLAYRSLFTLKHQESKSKIWYVLCWTMPFFLIKFWVWQSSLYPREVNHPSTCFIGKVLHLQTCVTWNLLQTLGYSSAHYNVDAILATANFEPCPCRLWVQSDKDWLHFSGFIEKYWFWMYPLKFIYS